MTLSSGTKLGPYEIVGSLGAGGMGEVYRAKDPRLGREVALKVLPESFADDADRLRRFEQEARAASSLNHPNIVTIHEIGSAAGTTYLAMELVDGASLRELLASGPLAPKRMLDVAVQIAEALAKAHGAGIVHRDLKPENVMVSRDGYVKLLDFGLAKLFVAPSDETAAPTAAPQHTLPGSVMGTVGYMSPEQASGRPLDFRSDQFSLGSILYEMATGRRAFQRPTGAQTMAAIIQDEPDSVAQVSPKTAAPFRWIVERCLAKDPDERYASTRDLARDLKSVREHLGEVTTSASGAAPVAEPARKRSPVLPIAAVVAVVAAIAGLYAGRRTGAIPQPTFQRLTFQRGTVSTARFAPDGSSVYYTAAWDGSSPRIYSLRPGNPESSVLPLPSASLMSISPAGEMAILVQPGYSTNGFSMNGTLARVPLSGAAPKEVLAKVSFAEWAPGGTELAVVHYAGGKERLEYPIGRVLFDSAGWIGNPRFSADGRSIAFVEHSSAGDDGHISVVDLGGRKRELTGRFATVQGLTWSPDGREIWFTAAKDGIERELYGVTPAGKLRLIRTMQGTPALLDVRPDGSALISEDDYRSGILLFGPGQPTGKDLTWFDWSGDRGMSADGKLVLFDESGEGGGANGGVYLRAADGSPAVRLGDGVAIALSPDSEWAMTRTVLDPPHFVLVPVKAGQPKVFPPDGLGFTTRGDFFPDGSKVAFLANAPGKGTRLYVQDLSGGSPKPISEEGLYSSRVSVSPDSRWIAANGSDTRTFLFPSAGGTPTPLAASKPGDIPAGWTGDGKGVYVAQRAIPCSVDLIDVASGRRIHVRDLQGIDASGVTLFGPARVTPDGRTMLAGMNRVLSVLYRLQGLK